MHMVNALTHTSDEGRSSLR